MFLDFENFQKPGLRNYITKPKNRLLFIFRNQSELALVNTPPWIFSLGSYSPSNLSIAKGSKKCAKGSKIRVHPTGWPQYGNSRAGAFMGTKVRDKSEAQESHFILLGV
jgi:hypothetical protein